MPSLTESQQNKVKILLGYASTPHILTTELQENKPQEVIDQVLAIVDDLTRPANEALGDVGGIDAQLKSARSDSMAKGVGSLRLSYPQHVAHLKSEGTRLLSELSMLLGVRLLYNKYSGGSKTAQVRYW